MDFKRIYLVCFSAIVLASCSVSRVSSSFPQKYYTENESTITTLEDIYSKVYKAHPIAVQFSDEAFEYLRVELKRDSIRYIYEFNIHDPNLIDTLSRYGYDTTQVMDMILDMKRIKCTWINNMDYFVDGNQRSLVYMAIRPTELDIPFSSKKYFILTFYEQKQYYDEEGRLLDKRNLRRIRKVNNEIFRRINDKVCYTISTQFR